MYRENIFSKVREKYKKREKSPLLCDRKKSLSQSHGWEKQGTGLPRHRENRELDILSSKLKKLPKTIRIMFNARNLPPIRKV